MRLSELSPGDLQQHLRGSGLRLRTGEFVSSIRSPLDQVADAIATLYGDFPLATDEAIADFHVRIAPRRRARFWKPAEATFSIEGQGRFNPFSAAMTVAYLEWGLNWCIANLAHHRLVMHAATVERNGRALLIAGMSGSGKSTLAAALALDGWRLLSDEFALVSREDLHVSALARPISLKNESIDLIAARDSEAVLGPASRGDPKGLIRHLRPHRAWVDRVQETAVPTWLLLLDFQRGAAPRLQEAAKGATMMQLIAHSFNYYLLGQQGFETLGGLVERCECFRFTYGDLDAGVAMLREMSQSYADAK